MKILSRFYHQRMALVNLDAHTATAVALSPEHLLRGIGGVGLAKLLTKAYPGALVLTTGPLTGSFAPASGLLTASFTHHGNLRHIALPYGHGTWLRQSGFDALIVTGTARHGVSISCAYGNCALATAPRERQGRTARRTALLAATTNGKAGLLLADTFLPDNAFVPGNTSVPEGASLPHLPASAGCEHGVLAQGRLLGHAMQEKNISDIFLAGGLALPPLPVPLDNPARRLATSTQAHFKDELARHGLKALPPSVRWKSAACWHCPSPCLAWIKTGAEHYVLCADHKGFAAAVLACGESAPQCLALCDECGLDLADVAPVAQGIPPQQLAELLPKKIATAFSGTTESATTHEAKETDSKTTLAGHMLGVCPLLLQRTPALSTDILLGLLDEKLRSQAVTALGEYI